MMYLLDVNVLLAFRYVAHVHHVRAKRRVIYSPARKPQNRVTIYP